MVDQINTCLTMISEGGIYHLFFFFFFFVSILSDHFNFISLFDS